MLEDQTFTGRHAVPQPGTGLNCHASAYPAFRKLGQGDIELGFETLNSLTYREASEHVSRPVACIDCHDPKTLALRVTRPGFARAIRAPKEASGRKGYDVNAMATRQEMRSYVCARCHVEYYFQGPEKRLVFPWAKGLRAEEILATYDEAGFRDWVHRALQAAREAGRGDGELVGARSFQRRAQFFLDFVEAENSTGFHAPEEALRVLALSIDAARKGVAALSERR